MPEEIMIIIIVGICVGLPVLSATLIKLARIIKGEGSGKKSDRRTSEAEDIELIQTIHQGLNRLEKRIDAIETIIIERNK